MTEYRSGRKKGSGYRIRLLDNNPDGYIPSSGFERWFRTPEKKDDPPNTLIHYGVKGQKWGVITKEYEPVAVDHRKIGNQTSIVQKVRGKANARREYLQAYRQQVIADRQARREKRQKTMKITAGVLAAGTLAIAAYKGYKLSGLRGTEKEIGKRALRSLLVLKPKKGDLGKLLTRGSMALDAKNRSETMGMAKVMQHFRNGGNILRMRYYREKIRKARSYVNKLKNVRLDQI